MAGKHRAPALTSLTFALLMGVSVDQAADEITNSPPCVEFHQVTALRDGVATSRQGTLCPRGPTCNAYLHRGAGRVALCSAAALSKEATRSISA